jgi:hypothetical protein
MAGAFMGKILANITLFKTYKAFVTLAFCRSVNDKKLRHSQQVEEGDYDQRGKTIPRRWSPGNKGACQIFQQVVSENVQ